MKTPVGLVPVDKVPGVWRRIEPILARAVKPVTGQSTDSVLLEVLKGRFQLWVVGDLRGVVITQVQSRPTQRVVWIQFLAGDAMSEWLSDWIGVLEKYAVSLQCTAIEFNGRKGWHKISADYPEYKPIMTLFRKDLEG